MFLPKRDTGGAFGAPLLLREVCGVHRDARMVEAFVPKPTGPSGVPFIEMLEYPPLKKPL